MTLQEIFDTYKTIAVVGMSSNQVKPAFTVPVYFIRKGYNVIPVNPMAEEIVGKKCYPTITDVPEEIEILNVFRRSEDCLNIVQEAVERKKQKGDIKLIWLQEGIINNDAKALAEENGIEFIQNMCMFKEYAAL